ncbi:MAG: hypothetical protein IKY23_00205 [Lachnospiraceae bacterium]|nr:hypothetical protein [Lachnospiraceae bacterium]
MNITFDGAQKEVRTHSNVDRDTTVYRGSESTGTVQRSIFALDISGTVMDNNAYAGHGRTAEEVMQDAAQQDITARRNYMAVMSNSLSDEDFAKLQKDGFHPGSTDVETVVTIVDHIKTAMMKGGTYVTGYTDTMDAAQLKEITGSAVFAGELEQAFGRHDIPITRENAEAAKKAYEVMESVGQLSDGAKKYLIENHLQLTPENLYTAKFAGAADAGRQGKGYYAAGDVNGYLAKKPESINYDRLMPAMEKTILQAGLSVAEDTLADAKWLIEKGIPFCEETLLQKQAIDSFPLPMPMQEFAEAAAIAIADGREPMKGDLTAKQSILEKAVTLKEQAEAVTEAQVKVIHTSELPFTLRNLILADSGNEYDTRTGIESGSGNISGKPADAKQPGGQQENAVNPAFSEKIRLLHEVRFSMTVSVNVRLLKKGYPIDTVPMEELLKAIRSEESLYHQQLVQDTEPKAAAEKADFYQQTLFGLERIKCAPLSTVADISVRSTLSEVSALAGIRTADYQKAGKSYEALWTAPRADLGDSIRKAFANVDDILADLGQEPSEENRRVVRILGYNSMEMTRAHFDKVKQADGLLREVVGKMNPAEVLNMIREGINPLSMQLTELKEYLDDRVTAEEEMESYSRFLYRLEKKNGVTDEERSAFIGIYRLLRQIEKKDDASIGALLQTGADMTLSNLLSFVRSSKKSMDYQIDDTFGGVDAKEGLLKSITEQIQKGFVGTRAELEQALADEETAEIDKQYEKETYDHIRLAMRSEDAVLRQLRDYGQSVNAEHLLAAGEALKGSSEIFKKLRKIARERENDTLFEEGTFPEILTGKEETLKSYEEMADKVLKMLEAESFEGEYSSVDIKAMSALYKQITFHKSMAREENYEIPVEIGGELTAVNLKMIHKEDGESKVTITMETQRLGRTAAEFTFQNEYLTGYGICDLPEGKALLSEGKARLEQLLLKEGIKAGDIRFMENAKLDLKEFSLKAEDGRVSAVASDRFYQAAKAYIGYIQEISR